MSEVIARVKAHPSGVLLLVQILGVVAYPFATDTALGRATLSFLAMVVLGLAVWTVRSTPALTWLAITLGLPALALTFVEVLQPDSQGIALASAVTHAVFYFYTAYALVRYLFDDTWVTNDELFAVGAAFTIVAWGFAYVFMAVQILDPGSFISYAGEGQRTWFELLFLSFANLTSVGLSDVAPVKPHARSFAMLEHLAGVLYVAMVISRMVSLTVLRFRG